MNLYQFKEFLTIAELGNFEKAAEELFITQSSLSKHIKKMETELGTELFDRSNRKTVLTSSGATLLPYAEKIVDLEAQYLEALHSYSLTSQYTLNVGTVDYIVAYNISDIFVQFQQKYPTIQLNIACQGPLAICQGLMNGNFDLAFYRHSANDATDEFTYIPFSDDQLVLVCPADHPLANRGSIPLSALRDERLIGFQKNTFLSQFVLASCRDAGFEPRISVISQRTANQIELAAHGMGICLVMKKMAQHMLNSHVSMVDIEPAYKCNIDLCYLKDKKLPPPAQKFIQFLRLWQVSQTSPSIVSK